jgi:hypothetical protein
MKNFKILCTGAGISALVVLCIAGICLAQMQSVADAGGVDWEGRAVTAKGIGAPNPNLPQAAQRPAAIKAAKSLALRNALEMIKGINLNSETTVENFMTTSDVVRTNVSGFIQKFKFENKPHYMSDGTVEISVTIPIDGVLMDALLPSEVGATPQVTSMPAGVTAAKTVFTGLIIDAKGSGVTPAIAPKILDESDKEVYGSAYVSRDWAVKYGMAAYAKSVKKAAELKDRVGDNPGTVKALRASGPNKTDIVISKKDADSIRSAAENLKFLAECRVAIVVD